ncbi:MULTISPECIES: polyhydroxyalkanoate synthesis repressor PhaR [Alcaligenaceae]|jgi:polyhydroxyalkanoate synthesis repressor PhaR|uniref:Polyhydroxyalkanoate synthesis repressor PhaR n=1 Tax=Neopusillimonas maritima TaxID=2026239 RepID=A0A3A1YTM9_9BURK|nr:MULTISPECIES: polyhydroxyalkanoate synthesis repressor PhaR [Alcaligenaceae]QIM50006.1 polyhydroxyalkanoate synthesis repressor PhaR [Pusillimonas sp. DMV24BSW_D]RII82701.1 polyhydroxyalkanoate synthesis repressor PhaR [Neopusillimonas maritima]RIY40250.1 polyhydroxyalkanoate synthesis repressor PhaR [Neopusillimonas maritima]|tara:strand:+ start:79 stop:657 length:579 start_codon:yes stop_codon:yes gene_type:complete
MARAAKSAESKSRLIKKYPNRRLYDTRNSAYITLADVKQLVLDNESFTVVDVKSGEDLTRSILLQIILEEETGGMPMFSADALAQIIRFYGNSMQSVMGVFLEKNIKAFIEIQEGMAEQSKNLYGGAAGPEAWTQFMSVQTPVLQNMMSQYIDQSKNLFVQMQDQMQDQTRNLFSTFPFNPAAPQNKKNDDS